MTGDDRVVYDVACTSTSTGECPVRSESSADSLCFGFHSHSTLLSVYLQPRAAGPLTMGDLHDLLIGAETVWWVLSMMSVGA